MISKQLIFKQFKDALEKGDKPNTVDFKDCKTTSEYYAYLKFLQFYKLNPAISIEHGTLLRQAIRYSNNKIKNINIPLSSDILNVALECGIKYKNGVLTTEPYKPDWIKYGKFQNEIDKPPQSDLIKEDFKSEFWLHQFNTNKWKSFAQREVFFKALYSKKGSINILGLPTGSGKSLIFQIMSAYSSGLTLVIVPTIALAIDQYYSSLEVLSNFKNINPTVYTSNDKQNSVIESLKNGTCKLLFTSPESIVSGRLKKVLTDINNEGKLENIFVDEAHIIESWGADFRLDFQLMPSFFKNLYLASDKKIKTFLLSATFTENTKQLFKTLFDYAEIDELIFQRIRPEIRLFYQMNTSTEKRDENVLEALKYLPRPLILYNTTKEDVEKHYNLLKTKGYNSIEMFDGSTSDEDRVDILNRWRKNEIEIIVATSAFGMGVDKLDVRTVIHCCYPESFHRFYQEIGRGGRDGANSISLFLPTPEDKRIAKHLQTKLLGEKIEKYWEDLLDSKTEQRSGKVTFYLNKVPPHLMHGRVYSEHILWKKRLILMLARYSIIKIEDYKIETSDEDQVKKEYITIKCSFNPNNINELLQRIEEPRNREKKDFERNFDLIDKFLKKEKGFCIILKRVYGLSFKSFCTDCFNCLEKNLYDNRDFKIKHIYKVSNIEIEIIKLSFDLELKNISKFLRFLRDIISQNQIIICVSKDLFDLINDNISLIPFSKIVPFRLVLPSQIDEVVVKENDQILFFHDKTVIKKFKNFKRTKKVTHFFSKSCKIIENDNRLIFHYDNPRFYQDENEWTMRII